MNSALEPVIEPPNDDVGAWLRAARQRSGLSLRQIADTTKYAIHILEALERNRVSQLPDGLYLRGIVRAYATAVGLSPEKTLRTFLVLQSPDESPLLRMTLDAEPQRGRQALRAAANLMSALIPVLAGMFLNLQSHVDFGRNGRAGHTLGDAGSPFDVRIARRDHRSSLIQP